MTLAVAASGTQTAVISTTHTLSTPTAGKTYQLNLDLNALAAGDTLTIIVQAKVAGGSFRNAASLTLAGPQGDPFFQTAPYPAASGCQFQILQSTGTGRAFPWEVVSLD